MDNFAFGRKNYILRFVGLAVIIAGLTMMSGAGSNEEMFNPDIFSARRIKVAPLVSLAGFVFVMVAIMYRGRKDEDTKDEDRTTSLR